MLSTWTLTNVAFQISNKLKKTIAAPMIIFSKLVIYLKRLSYFCLCSSNISEKTELLIYLCSEDNLFWAIYRALTQTVLPFISYFRRKTEVVVPSIIFSKFWWGCCLTKLLVKKKHLNGILPANILKVAFVWYILIECFNLTLIRKNMLILSWQVLANFFF